jgi:flavodoxin
MTQTNTNAKKVLIVFFSRDGQNWGRSGVTFIKEGNTRRAIRVIQEQIAADSFEIVPDLPYPEDYYRCTQVAQEEFDSGAKPAFKGAVPDTAAYDAVIIATPIWWGHMPKVLEHAVESLNLNGKTVLVLTTHAGSGLGDVPQAVKRIAPGAKAAPSLSLYGTEVDQSSGKIQSWLEKAGLR